MKQDFFRLAKIDDSLTLSVLVNSAYRGDSSRQGWTTEADLLGGQRTDPEILAEEMKRPGSVFLLVEEQGELIGSVFLKRQSPRVYLGMLTVRPDLQDRGWGAKILKQAEAWSQNEWQAQIVEMTVISVRHELIAWYQRHGYRLTEQKTPFPYGDERFGKPKVADLEFLTLEKSLV